MNKSFREIFNAHSGRLIHKFDHYFEIYDRYFSKYQGKEIVILEIGIAHGGSLQIWKKYFGEKVKIYAVDINPDCKKLAEDNIQIFIGSQQDPEFLSEMIGKMPRPDIILDDGGHMMKQQITSFNMLYNHLKDGGVYVCEDTCTSYWYEYGGGLRRKGTFVEFSKKLIDSLYTSHFKNRKITASELTKSINAIHFYDSVVVFEKRLRPEPVHVNKGEKSVNHDEDPVAGKRTFIHRVIKKLRSI
ncbi:MAG TPA: class I SAM-dependent methyltransferase [Puia sp.]|nr:class I SAM-dependent methyltransferase [Puia sp.]